LLKYSVLFDKLLLEDAVLMLQFVIVFKYSVSFDKNEFDIL
jgi:hypothetical protein